jgi:hypothetical protein
MPYKHEDKTSDLPAHDMCYTECNSLCYYL